jgi:hypothetical protein
MIKTFPSFSTNIVLQIHIKGGKMHIKIQSYEINQ